MTQDKKQEFTRRLSCCNRGGMVVVMYEILFAYLEEAQEAQGKDYPGFKSAIGKAQNVLRRFMDDLDFTYPVSGELFAIYQFANKRLSLAVSRNSRKDVEDVQRILKNLYDGFQEAAKQDTSEPDRKSVV